MSLLWFARNGWLLTPLVTLLVGSVPCVVVLLISALAARKGRRRELSELGEPAVTLDGCQPGDEVVLAGRLRHEGEGVACPGMRRKAAAATVEPSGRRFWSKTVAEALATSTRSEVMWLDLGEERIALEGPVEVVLGAGNWWSGRKDHEVDAAGGGRQAGYAVVRTVGDGDAVAVRGILGRREATPGDRDGGYREGAQRWQLRARSEVSALAVLARHRSRNVLSKRALLLAPWPVAFATVALATCLVVTIGHAKAVAWAETNCLDGCEKSGLCEAYNVRSKAVWKCRARGDADCRRSQVCRSRGGCFEQEGRCVAGSDADCRAATLCSEHGSCTLVGTRCEVVSDADCQGSEVCKRAGTCGALNGRCSHTTDRHCRDDQACAQSGRCTALGGRCDIGSDEDCAQSRDCRIAGGCALQQDEDGSSRRCVPKREEHCRQALMCGYSGACGLVEGRCGAVSQEDCDGASSCQHEEGCVLRDGFCVSKASCHVSAACTESGACKTVDDRCVAASNGDCRGARICRFKGRCTARDGVCIAGDEDCMGSVECATLGICYPVDGICQQAPRTQSGAP